MAQEPATSDGRLYIPSDLSSALYCWITDFRLHANLLARDELLRLGGFISRRLGSRSSLYPSEWEWQGLCQNEIYAYTAEIAWCPSSFPTQDRRLDRAHLTLIQSPRLAATIPGAGSAMKTAVTGLIWLTGCFFSHTWCLDQLLLIRLFSPLWVWFRKSWYTVRQHWRSSFHFRTRYLAGFFSSFRLENTCFIIFTSWWLNGLPPLFNPTTGGHYPTHWMGRGPEALSGPFYFLLVFYCCMLENLSRWETLEGDKFAWSGILGGFACYFFMRLSVGFDFDFC